MKSCKILRPARFASSLVPLLLISFAASQITGQISQDSKSLGIPFDRYQTRDKLSRNITFYLSAPSATAGKLPLIVYVQGSGYGSNFVKRDGRVVGFQQYLILQLAKDRARVMVVEKPGVNFLDESQQPGTAIGCSKAFLEEHTLDRWAEAVQAAIKAAHKLPAIDPARTLVVGHSEGGIVAARVAATDPKITHVACLAGGGPTQLFDLVETARAQTPRSATGEQAPDPGQQIYAAWKEIQADPNNTEKLFWAHPYRRWSSFLKASVLTELLRSRARIYVAQGTKDQAVAVTGFDVLRAELAVHGRDVTAERVEGGDHLFFTGPGDKQGMRRVFGNVVAWFLTP